MILTVQNVYNAPFEKWNLFFAHASGYLFDKERWYPYRDFTLGSICKKGGKVRWRQLM